MEAFEYAIKKDVRNNPIVREVDEAREREQRKWIGIGGLVMLLMLASAWQHLELRNHGYKLGPMRSRLQAAEDENRKLGLRLEELRSPRRIEELAAKNLHMVQPNRDEAIILERVRPSAPPASSVVAQR